MARRGSFGRLPRSSPSLDSTIIAIARAMQAARDANIMDAWREGGSFEGKPATDEAVIAHWQMRLRGVAKDDPLYDQYKNTVTQLQYTVAESKASTVYAQSPGEASDDRKMAAFYTAWAKKIPKDSEFYRVLQRDAAQFIRSANAKDKAGARSGRASAKAAAKKAAEESYQAAQTATSKKYEATGTYLTDTFDAIARARGLVGVSQDVRSFDTTDPSAIQSVIRDINTNPAAVLYHDPLTGKAVTGTDLLAQIKATDPDFGGVLTTDYYGQALRNQLTGQQIRLDRARASTSILPAHKAEANNIVKWQAYTSEIGREANAWPIEESYQNIRRQFLSTWLDPSATPGAKMAAWDVYRGGLLGLAGSKSHPPDDNTAARLMAEVNGDGAIDSLAENFTGLNASDHTTTTGTKGDITETHTDIQRFMAMDAAVKSGAAVWAFGQTGSDGVFHPGAGGEVGAASFAEVQAASPEGSVLTYITQGNGAPPIPVYVSGKAVTATVVDPNGEAFHSTPNDKHVATAFDLVIEGEPVRVYGYQDATGRTIYTRDAPWAANVQVQDERGSSTINLTITADVPTQSGGAFTVVRGSSGYNVDVNAGQYILNSDPVRAHAGFDPFTDSPSPTIAALMGTTEGKATLARLSNDPTFKAIVERDIRVASGYTLDAQTGQWVGGDALTYNDYNNKTQVGSVGVISGMDVAAAYNKVSTKGTFSVGTTGGPVTGSPPGPTDVAFPSDRLKGSDFSALGSAFVPNTNTLRTQNETSVTAGLSIKTRGQLTIPSPPPPPATETPQAVTTPAKIAPAPVPPPMPVVPEPVQPPGPTDVLPEPPPLVVAPPPVSPPIRPPGPTDSYIPPPAYAPPPPLPKRSGGNTAY